MGRKWLSICLVVMLLFGGATGTIFALDEMYIYYLDVGQAESTLLKGPDFVILIDAGDRGKTDVLEHLERLGVEAIDLFIVTHPHADHMGQAVEVLETFEVVEVWMSGYEHTTVLFEKLLDTILASDADYWEPRAGETFEFGELLLHVLNPMESWRDLHDSNIVIRAVYGDLALLFTGDAERRTEQDIMARGLNLESEVLQLGHHGSRTSSSLDFLLAVSPEVAVYSAGVPNSFGHPHEEVVNRLKILEIPLYGTDLNGTIIMQTDGLSYRLYTETGRSLLPVGSHPFPLGEHGGIDLNTASFVDLQRILHIGPERAREIMELREDLPLRSVDDLKWVSGLGPQRIEEIKQEGLAYVKGVMED